MLGFAIMVFPASAAGPKWQGNVPAQAKDQKAWLDLISYLLKNEYHYGAMAAAQRMLMLFTDLPSKELAYKTIIELIDRGYPFSSLAPFLPGDIDPEAPSAPRVPGDQEIYDFYNSYNLYKSLLDRDKNAQKWADNYLSKVDKEGFPKYKFYLAVELHMKGKLEEAETALKELLSKEYEDKHGPFIRKAARTLGRIYFEREEFEKALEVYKGFLLKMNPIAPSDWLEAAWSYYHLKKYPEALGMLYNMESRSAGNAINLEKYTIRALTCTPAES